jgi:hypothetical protein
VFVFSRKKKRNHSREKKRKSIMSTKPSTPSLNISTPSRSLSVSTNANGGNTKLGPSTPTGKMQNDSKVAVNLLSSSSSFEQKASEQKASEQKASEQKASEQKVLRKPQPSPEVNSKKYYPKDRPENYLSHYLELAKSNENNQRQLLIGTIAQNLKNSQFLQDMGIIPNKLCHCHKNGAENKCRSIDQNDVVSLIKKYAYTEEKDREWENGICKSCGIAMTMWNPAAKTQRISCFQICAFDVNTCLNKQSIPQLRIYCRGCCVIAESCHFDYNSMNYYRQILFRMTGDQSPGYYFPTIDIIDEKQRSVAIPANKNVGDRVTISRIWRAQEGFVTYSLPRNLEIELLKDDERKGKILKYNFSNVETNNSEYYGSNDPDIKRIKSVITAGATVAPWPPALETLNDGLSSSSSSISDAGGQGSGGTPTVAPVRKKRVESKVGKARSEAKARLLEEAMAPIKLYSTDDKFISFKIPIDPRKSVKKTSLSAMTLTALDRNLVAEGSNCLFSTQLMSTLEGRFDYEEFLRWGLDCFRQVTPIFLPQKSNHYSEDKWNDEDKKKIEDIGRISIAIKKKAEEIKKLKGDIKDFEVEKKEQIKGMRSKIISLVDSNESLELLSKHNLVAAMKERKPTKVNLKPDFVLNYLPHLLTAHKLVSPDISSDLISQKCKQITDALFDTMKGPQKKKTTFTLKYFNEAEEKEKTLNRRKRAKAS